MLPAVSIESQNRCSSDFAGMVGHICPGSCGIGRQCLPGRAQLVDSPSGYQCDLMLSTALVHQSQILGLHERELCIICGRQRPLQHDEIITCARPRSALSFCLAASHIISSITSRHSYAPVLRLGHGVTASYTCSLVMPPGLQA